MQVSNTSKSVSILTNKIIKKTLSLFNSSDHFPIPVRSALKSKLTTWCNQNLSNYALNALIVFVLNVVDFVRLANGVVPEVLDDYLKRVAITGVTVYVFFAYVIIM